MSIFGVWDGRTAAEIDAEFEALTREFTLSQRWPRTAVVAAVADEIAEHGCLSRLAAARIAEQADWAPRSLWRFAAAIDCEPQPQPQTGTFLDLLGSDEPFVFDELALTLVYLCGGNISLFRREVIETTGLPMPSLATLSRRWQQVPRPIREGVRSGHRNRFSNSFHIRGGAQANVNEVWELDDFSLDIRVLTDGRATGEETEVRLANDGIIRGVRPHLSLLVDRFSRFIVAWMLLDRDPTSADVGALFADAFEARPAPDGIGLVGGACDKVVMDNAKAFTSYVKEQLFASVPVQMAPAFAYTPIAKGMVERTGQTIQAMVVTGLSGLVSEAERVSGRALFDTPADTWMEFADFEALVADAIDEYNWRRVHSAIRATPGETYVAANTDPRTVPDEDLARRYLPLVRANGERIVQHTGVNALGSSWVSPSLDVNLIGQRVSVRSLHHRVDRLAVFTAADEFAGWVYETLDETQRAELIANRDQMGIRINYLAARAREAMISRTGAVSEHREQSMLKAAETAVKERKARGGAGTTSATGDTSKAPQKPTDTTAERQRTKDTPGGLKGTRRPPAHSKERSTRRRPVKAPAVDDLAKRQQAVKRRADQKKRRRQQASEHKDNK